MWAVRRMVATLRAAHPPSHGVGTGPSQCPHACAAGHAVGGWSRMSARHLTAVLALSAALSAGCDSASSNKATGARTVEPVVLTLANWQRGDADVGEWRQAVERLSDGAI